MKKLEKKAITLASLIKIYNELPKLAITKPHIKEEFDMTIYGVYNRATKEYIETECATHGCGLGNSALVFELVDSDFRNLHNFNYVSFGKRILPLCYDTFSDETNLWHFLFASSWGHFQPSFDQFIERVKYAIDTELDLGEWQYQKETFIYKK